MTLEYAVHRPGEAWHTIRERVGLDPHALHVWWCPTMVCLSWLRAAMCAALLRRGAIPLPRLPRSRLSLNSGDAG